MHRHTLQDQKYTLYPLDRLIFDRIQDSQWNNISILLYYIALRTQLNQFEVCVSSLIHENIENYTVTE